MIDIKEIFNSDDDVAKYVSLWLSDNVDSTDLAGACEYAADMHIPVLSVAPAHVNVIWPWLEKLNVKIEPRFYVDSVAGDAISNIAINIKSVFKQGADGAQLILHLGDMDKFADSLLAIRDDLFFNKDLSIGFDMFEIWPLDWASVFENLKKTHASSLLLIMTHDDRDKSDFIGRIYGALENWDADKNMELHVMLGESYGRAEQVYRLVSTMRPELLDKLKIFVSY